MAYWKRLGLALGLVASLATPTWAMDLSARSALVLDAQGRVLYQRNASTRLPPASTTKVLTVLVALETVPLDDLVKVSRRAAAAEPSKLGIKAGETYTVRELCYAALMKSANDACVAIAEHVAGSERRFAVLMNRKARLLGAMDSHFANASGLPAKNHYSTALDLAMILQAALQNPVFSRISTTTAVTLDWPGHHAPHVLRNKNRLLTQYPFPVLGKTGYTLAARHCYVGQAQCDSPVTVVLMGAKKLWPEAQALLDLGTKLSSRQLASTEEGRGQGDADDQALTF